MEAQQSRASTIAVLPADLATKLRAPQVINSLAQALDELVANSIDAHASHVVVELDVSSLTLQVVDDGQGVSPACFAFVAKKHCTSKLRNQKHLDSGVTTLGFRGEALASLADISLLQIISKAAGCFETHTKTVKGGRVIQQGLALEQKQKAGTIVYIRDFLHNQPVRRRHYAQSGMQKELERCRETVLRLALAHPEVTFKLSSRNPKQTLLNLTRGRSVEDVLPLIFADKVHSTSQVAHFQKELSIHGYITVPPAAFHHKHKQYLYVNNRHVTPGQIGKLVNGIYKQIQLEPEQQDQQQLKAAHQYPAFALQISCPADFYDVTSDPDKQHVEFTDWPSVLSAVQAAVLHAWHAVVGDRLLTELIQCKQCPANVQAQGVLSAATARASRPAAPDQPSSVWQTPSCTDTDIKAAVNMRKRKRGWLSSGLSASNEDLGLAEVFGASASSREAPLNQPRSLAGCDMWSADSEKSQRPMAGGLLAKLQSSAKLRFSGQHKHLTASAYEAPSQEHLSHEQLKPAESDSAERFQASNPELQNQAQHSKASAQTSTHAANRSGRCHRHSKRRAVSAPPHHRSQHRSAHTNPLHSLRTDFLPSPPTASAKSGKRLHADAEAMSCAAPAQTSDRWLDHAQAKSCKQSDAGATEVLCTAPAQTSDRWLGETQARQRHTVSGVCSQLKHRLAGKKVSDTFRQKRHGQEDRSLQQKNSARTGKSPVAASPRAITPAQEATMAATGLQASSSALRPEKEHMSNDVVPGEDVHTEPSGSKQALAVSGMPSASGQRQAAQLAPAAATFTEPKAGVSLLDDAQLQQQGGSMLPSVTDLLQSWSNPSIQPSSSKHIPDLAALLGAALHTIAPAAIARSELQQGIALRQMENKFIAVVCNGVLCVMDQHAADERIRLEKLRAVVLHSQLEVKSIAASPAVCMHMSSKEVQMLDSHKARLEQWGWRWRVPEDSSKPVVLTHYGCVLDTTTSGLDLQVYLHQLSETNGSELLPPAVTRTLNAKACRSAIMFGDPLLPTECAQLLSALKATQLCFSCAHGRPTLVPLVHVQKLREQLLQKTASLLAQPHLPPDTAGLKHRLIKLLTG